MRLAIPFNRAFTLSVEKSSALPVPSTARQGRASEPDRQGRPVSCMEFIKGEVC